MHGPTTRTFWRCVRTYPLVDEDFKSKAALGETMRAPYTPKRQRIFEGVSVYSDLVVAREQAQRFNPPYRYLAEIKILDDCSIPYEQTFRIAEHFTLWASSEDLQSRVVSVREVVSGEVPGSSPSAGEL